MRFLLWFFLFASTNAFVLHASDNNCSAKLSFFAKLKDWTRQVVTLPKTVGRLKQMVDQEFNPSILDENLFTFYGFHALSVDSISGDTDLGSRHFRQKAWRPVAMAKVNAGQIVNMSQSEFIGVMRYAMEIEDPILGYSNASGQGFRFLLPNIGRFMGKNKEEAEYAKLHGIKWCESAWCEEERRHGHLWAKLVETISGVKPPRENQVKPHEPAPTEAGAQFHHFSRQSTEWSATSSYLFLAAHAKGELRDAILNMARDEIKHLTILSGVQVYLFGRSSWDRMREMIKKSVTEFFSHKKERSTGSEVSSNPVSIIEVIISHLMVERKVRQYLKTLPYKTLQEIFEVPSTVKELARIDVEQAVLDGQRDAKGAGNIARRFMVRWPAKEIASEVRQIAFEEMNVKVLNKIVTEEFDGFKGAETFGSPESDQAIDRIHQVDPSKYNLFEWLPRPPTKKEFHRALFNRLRDYQIKNNFFIRTKNPIPDMPSAP